MGYQQLILKEIEQEVQNIDLDDLVKLPDDIYQKLKDSREILLDEAQENSKDIELETKPTPSEPADDFE